MVTTVSKKFYFYKWPLSPQLGFFWVLPTNAVEMSVFFKTGYFALTDASGPPRS